MAPNSHRMERKLPGGTLTHWKRRLFTAYTLTGHSQHRNLDDDIGTPSIRSIPSNSSNREKYIVKRQLICLTDLGIIFRSQNSEKCGRVIASNLDCTFASIQALKSLTALLAPPLKLDASALHKHALPQWPWLPDQIPKAPTVTVGAREQLPADHLPYGYG